MTQFAYYDHTVSAPSPILGWYDTGAFDYPNLPVAANLQALTPEQWAARMSGAWAVSGGALVPYTPPAPVLTPAQQAQAALAGGLTITSPTLGLVGVTFAAGEDTWTLVLSELAALQLSGSAAFADGDTVVHWPDIASTPASPSLHVFTPAQFSAFAKTLGAFVAGCRNTIIGKPGATVPAASVTIA